MAATNQYTLQETELKGGKMKAILWSEFADLVVPSFVSLLLTQSQKEAFDELAPGVVEMADMVIDYIEDTSQTYYAARPVLSEPENPQKVINGFWAKVLTGEAEIQLLLDDGEGYAHYFWGLITPQTVREEELDLTPDNEVRTGAFKCVSVMQKLKNVTIDQLKTAIFTFLAFPHEVYDVGVDDALPISNEFDAVKLHEIIAVMVWLTWGGAYNLGNVPIPRYLSGNYIGTFTYRAGYQINANNHVVSTGVAKFEDLYILLTRNEDSVKVSFFETNDDANTGTVGTTAHPVGQSWPVRFGNCYELLKSLVSQFGFVPRHYYDAGTDAHQIHLIDRGYSYGENLQFGEETEFPKTSSRQRKTDVVADITAAHRIQFAQDVPAPAYTMVRGLAIADEPPQYEDVDLNISLEFFPIYGRGQNDIENGEVYWREKTGYRLLTAEKLYFQATLNDTHGTSRTGLHRVGGGFYYNPDLDIYDPATQNDSAMAEIVAKYAYFRHGNRDRRSFVREFRTLKAYDGITDTHANIFPGKRTQITDSEGTRTFYATSVDKNAFTNTLIVRGREL